MNLFDLMAKITLDSSEYEKGLGDAEKKGGSFGSKLAGGLGKAAKVGAAAIGAASIAIAGFAGDSVKTGVSFDSSMSQIAATLGLTTDQIKNNVDGAGDTFNALREKALEMGAATNFSAEQAADGLNILAMSGFDAEQSMSMIEDVLHLAAAGSMDLASAAGYVSGAMKGFADDTKDAGYYADLMAKGATLANTNVQQLGDAMSSGAAGAAAYGQSAESMTVALLRLAEQGEVGAAAGTALSAAMKNLYTPSDQAKDVLKELGVAAYDETGAARDFNAVVDDLTASLSGMTDEEANAYKQTIFGIQGLDAYNKMAVTTTKKTAAWSNALANASVNMDEVRSALEQAGVEWGKYADTAWMKVGGGLSALTEEMIYCMKDLGTSAEELQEYLEFEYDMSTEDAIAAVEALQVAMESQTGEAAKQYETMTDNLQGDIDILHSAFDSFKLAISDELTPTIRDFVQFGSDSFSRLSDAFREGGLEGAMSELGDIVSEAIGKITEMLPDLISAGASLISSLVQGIGENLPAILDAALEIVMTLVNGINENGSIEKFVESAFTIVGNLVTSIGQALPELIPAAVSMIIQIVEGLLDNIDLIIDAAISLIIGLATGIVEALPHLIKAVPVILEKLVTAIIENVPILLEGLASALGELLTGTIDSIGGEGTTEKILDWFRGIPDAISTFFSETLPEVIDNIVQWFESIPQWFDELPSRLGAAIGTAIGTTIKFGLDVYNWATTELPGIVEGIAQWFADLPGEIGEWLSQAVQRFSEWASNLAQTAATEIPQLVDDIITGFSELPQRIVEVGSQIVNGLWDGIQSGWDWLVGKVEEFAHSLIDAAKSVLGIASPSKVFRDQVGKWLPLGMEEGFEDEMPKVQKDLQSSLDSMTGSLSANIETSGINLGNGAVPSFSDSSEKIVINVYGAQGQSITELVDEIERRLAFKQRQRKAAMA